MEHQEDCPSIGEPTSCHPEMTFTYPSAGCHLREKNREALKSWAFIPKRPSKAQDRLSKRVIFGKFKAIHLFPHPQSQMGFMRDFKLMIWSGETATLFAQSEFVWEVGKENSDGARSESPQGTRSKAVVCWLILTLGFLKMQIPVFWFQTYKIRRSQKRPGKLHFNSTPLTPIWKLHGNTGTRIYLEQNITSSRFEGKIKCNPQG